MGYRLEIYKGIFTGFTGGKLYGYIDDEKIKDLKSYQYLVNIGKVDEEFDKQWGYGFNKKILLNKDEFREFIELYKEDLNEYGGENTKECFNKQYNSKGFQEFLDEINDKIISWEG